MVPVDEYISYSVARAARKANMNTCFLGTILQDTVKKFLHPCVMDGPEDQLRSTLPSLWGWSPVELDAAHVFFLLLF